MAFGFGGAKMRNFLINACGIEEMPFGIYPVFDGDAIPTRVNIDS